MKKGVIFFVSVSLIVFWLCSLSLAVGGKRMEMRLKDGKVSADVDSAPLTEVINEIGKKWGIGVEIFGELDAQRLISTKFEDTSPAESLQRLLRGINFVYIPGEKLYLVGI